MIVDAFERGSKIHGNTKTEGESSYHRMDTTALRNVRTLTCHHPVAGLCRLFHVLVANAGDVVELGHPRRYGGLTFIL